MADAARIKGRYETPAVRSKGAGPTTRAEHNRKFGADVPVPDWPPAGDYIWDAFTDMCRDRDEGERGPLVLGPSRIKAWMELTGSHLSPDEVEVIRQMDLAWLGAVYGEIAVSAKVAAGKG